MASLFRPRGVKKEKVEYHRSTRKTVSFSTMENRYEIGEDDDGENDTLLFKR
jgi:hypothetical protein